MGEIITFAEHALKMLPKKPGQGLLLFIETEKAELLHELALALAKKVSHAEPMTIYVIQGQMLGENRWTFSRIKRPPRIKLKSDGSMITEIGGLIFPQDKPVVLLVECFDWLEFRDQRALSHLVDGKGGEFALHSGSILIAGLISTHRRHLEPGASNRGQHFDLKKC